MEGSLVKNNTTGGAEYSRKVFCVLMGYTLWEFDTEADARAGLWPRAEADVIGIDDGDAAFARDQDVLRSRLPSSSHGVAVRDVLVALLHVRADDDDLVPLDEEPPPPAQLQTPRPGPRRRKGVGRPLGAPARRHLRRGHEPPGPGSGEASPFAGAVALELLPRVPPWLALELRRASSALRRAVAKALATLGVAPAEPVVDLSAPESPGGKAKQYFETDRLGSSSDYDVPPCVEIKIFNPTSMSSALPLAHAAAHSPINATYVVTESGARSLHLGRVARIPPNEGHVFKTKARAPTLMLLETVDDPKAGADLPASAASPSPLVGGSDSDTSDDVVALELLEQTRASERDKELAELLAKQLGDVARNQGGEPVVRALRKKPALGLKIERLSSITGPGLGGGGSPEAASPRRRRAADAPKPDELLGDVVVVPSPEPEARRRKSRRPRRRQTGSGSGTIDRARASAGIIETMADAVSLDGLKKAKEFTTLKHHFHVAHGGDGRHAKARKAFVSSMAAYSLVCHLLGLKDRHNGNILLDSFGHVIHIDFGFLLGQAPGGSFSLERVPFKLTAEHVDAMGGWSSDGFADFVVLLACGFAALQKHASKILHLVEIMAKDSPFPCFKNGPACVDKMRAKLKLHFTTKEQVAHHVAELVRQSYNAYGTRQYDLPVPAGGMPDRAHFTAEPRAALDRSPL
ncbi:phosphatidylinositol kinase [Aureococcus anophagefferens]|nr:phosphatidylinositol kinase [Aureococcus anophagefferens]